MQDDVPSPTALKVAALRALHQTAEVPPVFADPLAARILGSSAPDLLAAARRVAGETQRLRATLAVRAVVAEEVIAEAAARGVRQCVILGAGLETFACRNRDPSLRVFEVDHPATQSWKRGLLRETEIAVPASVRFVAVNLERDDLVAALADSDLDFAQPVVFAMLGVVFYLARDAVVAPLRRLAAACARGTEIVFDYTEPLDRAEPEARAAYEAAAVRVAAGGEPWVSFFEPAELQATLRDLGFARVDDIDAAALNARFCAGRTDGLAVASLLHLVRART
ncbi:MAG: class I SAM-dependent methyltransferase [Caulobacteraceae bacterium]|nr:class I SAM-dependent methyltransferase [Caulobacter sp.]